MKSPADKWAAMKAVILAQVNKEGKVFINPYRDGKAYQCALELVGKGEIQFDGACFKANGPGQRTLEK